MDPNFIVPPLYLVYLGMALATFVVMWHIWERNTDPDEARVETARAIFGMLYWLIGLLMLVMLIKVVLLGAFGVPIARIEWLGLGLVAVVGVEYTWGYLKAPSGRTVFVALVTAGTLGTLLLWYLPTKNEPGEATKLAFVLGGAVLLAIFAEGLAPRTARDCQPLWDSREAFSRVFPRWLNIVVWLLLLAETILRLNGASLLAF
jgi:hypothetical protein